MKIKKRSIYAIITLLILVIGIFTINASHMHHGHDFEIKVDGDDITLQNAMDNFSGSHTYALPFSIPDPGHGPDEIWVSVDDGEMSLQQALSTPYSFCKSSPTTSYLGPSDKSKAYHYANEIEISPGKSFQDAIDNGEFSPVNYNQICPSGDASCINAGIIVCDGSCTGTYKSAGISCGTNMECDGNGNCVTACVSNYGQSCGGGVCTISTGTVACDGTCVGASYVAKGINCYSDTKACDGYGNCLGWSGTGCGGCSGSSTHCNLNGNQGRWEDNDYWHGWSYTRSPRCYTKLYCWWQIFRLKPPKCGRSNSWQMKP